MHLGVQLLLATFEPSCSHFGKHAYVCLLFCFWVFWLLNLVTQSVRRAKPHDFMAPPPPPRGPGCASIPCPSVYNPLFPYLNPGSHSSADPLSSRVRRAGNLLDHIGGPVQLLHLPNLLSLSMSPVQSNDSALVGHQTPQMSGFPCMHR